METLHLTYEEVRYKIPYRDLIIMQMDKQHIASDDTMVEVDEKEFFQKKGFKFDE